MIYDDDRFRNFRASINHLAVLKFFILTSVPPKKRKESSREHTIKFEGLIVATNGSIYYYQCFFEKKFSTENVELGNSIKYSITKVLIPKKREEEEEELTFKSLISKRSQATTIIPVITRPVYFTENWLATRGIIETRLSRQRPNKVGSKKL